ncbi:threonine/serine dehydratase [Sporolactobacillus sp. THM7-4]|nr:threonine/serine dehydratase [Sporolactobacillus sp. THM7-4]
MVHLSDIDQARERIAAIARVTPLLQSEQLSQRCDNQVFLKSEHLQKTGSFKIRGASNKVKLAIQNGARYVTTASSGNHGQAVAYIANRLGIPSTIVVPEDARICKINAIKAYHGYVEKCGTTSAERLPRAKELAGEKNGVYIPPYDDPDIIAGQGTIGLEILEQLPDADAVIVPIGGGGLISGILMAIKSLKPQIKVIGVEPEIANDTYLSLQRRQITAISGESTVADGLRTLQPGQITFPIMMKYVDDIVLVSEEEIRRAFSFVLERMKQMIEPSSATTLAALMFHKVPLRNQKIVTVISGGNVDVAKLNDFIML